MSISMTTSGENTGDLGLSRMLLPLGQEDQFEEKPIASGTRMIVFRNGDTTVLRTPLRSEDTLKSLLTQHPSPLISNGISSYTKEEIERHRIMFMYLGNSMMPVSPIPMVDTQGRLRTYAVQELIDPNENLPFPWSCRLDRLSKETIQSLVKLIKRIRSMLMETGLIPDLAGQGNVLISKGKRHKGRVYLVDVNNVQSVLKQHEWINLSRLKELVPIDPNVQEVMQLSPQDLRKIFSLMVQSRAKFYDTLHPLFLDEYQYPVADQSLSVLHQWEQVLGISVPGNPYSTLTEPFSLRDWVVRNILEDFQGGTPP